MKYKDVIDLILGILVLIAIAVSYAPVHPVAKALMTFCVIGLWLVVLMSRRQLDR